MAKTETESTPLTTKEAHAILASLRFGPVAAVLKNPDFAMLVALTFAGFRVDANGYANPVVRRRLAEEATRNADFSDKLRELAEQAKAAPVKPAGATPVSIPKQSLLKDDFAVVETTTIEKYRVERDRLKRERDEEAERRRVAENELTHARMDSLSANVARIEVDRELARLRQKAERLERKLRRAEETAAELRKLVATRQPLEAVSDSRASHSPAQRKQTEPVAIHPFVAAVHHLIDKQKWQPARQLAEDVLRYHPNDADALDIHAKAAEGTGDTRTAAENLRTLLALQVTGGHFAAAAEVLARLFGIAPEQKAAREYFNALAHAQIDFGTVREFFDRMRSANPDVHKALHALAQGEIGEALFAQRAVSNMSPDTALPLAIPASLGRVVTARLIVSWIDKGNSAAVQALRASLSSAATDQRDMVSTALDGVTAGDQSYLRLLTRPSLAGPTVVDVSNVAWHGQEMLSAPKPRAAYIVAVRRALRERGFFPIVMVADANLPFVVDEPNVVRKMVADQEITLVQSGTDADEYILREAQRLSAPVVTNDYMTEWDPAQDVHKMQYTIAHNTGIASIYS